jgi:WD40 repeat protein
MHAPKGQMKMNTSETSLNTRVIRRIVYALIVLIFIMGVPLLVGRLNMKPPPVSVNNSDDTRMFLQEDLILQWGADNTICFSSEPATLLIDGAYDTIKVLSIESRQASSITCGGRERRIAVVPKASLLYVASGEGQIQVWDLSRLEIIRTHQLKCATIECFNVSVDGGQFAIVDSQRDFTVWKVAKQPECINKVRLEHDVSALVLSADGTLVASGDPVSHTIRIWDTGKQEHSMSVLASNAKVRGSLLVRNAAGPFVTFVGNTHLIAVNSGEKGENIKIWDADSGKEISSRGFGALVTALASSADGRYIAVGIGRGELAVWDWRKGKIAARIQAYAGTNITRQLVFSNDGKWLAARCEDVSSEEVVVSPDLRIWSIHFADAGE